MKPTILSFFLFFALATYSQDPQVPLPNKIVPLGHAVYDLLDYHEASGYLGCLPLARPYTKKMVAAMLEDVKSNVPLSSKERKVIALFMEDLYRPVNGWIFKQETLRESYGVIGAGAKITGRLGAGSNASWSTSSVAEPFVAGDLGENLGFFGSLGTSIEKLAPDMFYKSYVKDGQVNLPFINTGYSYHPYQFVFETMRAHYGPEGGENNLISERLTAGLIYHGELTGSWIEDALRVNIHNKRRSWGYSGENLNLSEQARGFPGIDLVIEPVSWMRYSFLTGSLFAYFSQTKDYRKAIYGYDLGHVQKMISLHMIEIMPGPHFHITATGGNIWSKRLEPAYLMPFIFPHLAQIDVGDHDNLSTSINFAFMIPGAGKTWFSLFIDEFSFLDSGPLLKMPRNRYAWQLGWNSNLLGALIPGTQTRLAYTRLTPFVYTHYPEEDFKPFNTDRPLDMTYTHDEANLGFYLPPNSAEAKFDIINVAVQDLTLMMKNRFIIHGTNDLASDSLMIFGDIYKHQSGNVSKYPLMDFTNDGIYDFTWFTELKADWKIRNIPFIGYARLVGSLGFSYTWWKSNNSGVTAPEPKRLFTGALGVVVDI